MKYGRKGETIERVKGSSIIFVYYDVLEYLQHRLAFGPTLGCVIQQMRSVRLKNVCAYS